MKLTVGSRDSRLAVAQARLVMDALQAAHPELRLELRSEERRVGKEC